MAQWAVCTRQSTAQVSLNACSMQWHPAGKVSGVWLFPDMASPCSRRALARRLCGGFATTRPPVIDMGTESIGRLPGAALLQMMMGGAASPCRVPSIGQGGDGPTSSQIGGWKPLLFRETKRASRHAHTPRLPRWTSCSLSEPEECPDRTLRLWRLRHAALQLDRTTSRQPLTRQIFRCIQSHRTAMSSSLIIALHCYDRLSGSKTAPWLLGLHPRMGRHLALLANANLGHQT